MYLYMTSTRICPYTSVHVHARPHCSHVRYRMHETGVFMSYLAVRHWLPVVSVIVSTCRLDSDRTNTNLTLLMKWPSNDGQGEPIR